MLTPPAIHYESDRLLKNLIHEFDVTISIPNTWIKLSTQYSECNSTRPCRLKLLGQLLLCVLLHTTGNCPSNFSIVFLFSPSCSMSVSSLKSSADRFCAFKRRLTSGTLPKSISANTHTGLGLVSYVIVIFYRFGETTKRTATNRPFSWEAKSTIEFSCREPASASVGRWMYPYNAVVVFPYLFLPPWGRVVVVTNLPVVWRIMIITWSMTIPHHFAHDLLHDSHVCSPLTHKHNQFTHYAHIPTETGIIRAHCWRAW